MFYIDKLNTGRFKMDPFFDGTSGPYVIERQINSVLAIRLGRYDGITVYQGI